MAIIKCKMCGGDIELVADKTFGTCEFCGNTMTLPKIDDDQRAAAFNRGNHFRRIGEFDKALAVYERIVREDDTDAEAHWCCALCRFGIEYVEDPATYEYLPTCHRASFDSFLEDVDYLAAVEHSEGVTRRQYQKDAAKIAEVQRGILATSQNAEPYDVFICYKESDANGDRTRDSLLAQDIYYQLTEQGRKVFYARITLEDVAGAQYEPYIFAALNSAKVMIVVGTKPEYLNAVWVKNEWSRFLAMMKKDRHKLLLPCYRDMDPYDMPEALSVLQSYDMSKIGFIQDLIRGISKVLDAEKKPEPVKQAVVAAPQSGGANIEPLLERVFMFLEDGDWDSANEYCEKVLDIDPKNPRAYLGKLMAELRVRRQEELKDQERPFNSRNYYQKVMRFADDALKATLTAYIEYIEDRNENARLEGIYANAQEKLKQNTEASCKEAAGLFETIQHYRDAAAMVQQSLYMAEEIRCSRIYAKAQAMLKQNTETYCKEAAGLFETIRHYRDADVMMQQSLERAEEVRKDAILEAGKQNMDSKLKTLSGYESAIEAFQKIPGWRNADALADTCREKLAALQAKVKTDRQERERQAELARKEAERIRKRNRKIGIIFAIIGCLAIAFVILLYTVIIPNNKYQNALTLMEEGKYTEAIAAFEELDGYQDSEEMIAQCHTAILDRQYEAAIALMDAKKYSEAIRVFEELDGYRDSAISILECNYREAMALMDAKKFPEAIAAFEELDGYRDSEDMILKANYDHAMMLLEQGKKAQVLMAFASAGEYLDASARKTALWNQIAVRESVSAAFRHTVGLKADGTVVAVGSNEEGRCDVSAWTDIVAISAGRNHTVGLKADGTVIAVGWNKYGQCDVSAWTDIVAISAGYWHTVGLKADGTVVAVGDNYDGQCAVSNWTDIVAISAGYGHTVGLKADGTVVAVGDNDEGQCYVSSWTDIVAISAGYGHTVGLKADGTVVAVGDNVDGQCDVSAWTDIVAISAGSDHTVGLKANGTVVAVGDNRAGLCDVSDWTDIVAISAGSRYTVGLKVDGTVVAVGDNDDGQCKVSGWQNIKLPN